MKKLKLTPKKDVKKSVKKSKKTSQKVEEDQTLGKGIKILLYIMLSFLLIFPLKSTWSNIGSKKEEIQSINSDQEKVEKVFTSIDKVSLQDLKDDIKILKEKYPPTQDIPGYTRDLEDIAEEAGVSITSVAPGSGAGSASGAGAGEGNENSAASQLTPYTLSIQIETNESSLLKFIYELSKAKRQYSVKQVSFNLSDSDVTGAGLSLEVYSWQGWGKK